MLTKNPTHFIIYYVCWHLMLSWNIQKEWLKYKNIKYTRITGKHKSILCIKKYDFPMSWRRSKGAHSFWSMGFADSSKRNVVKPFSSLNVCFPNTAVRGLLPQHACCSLAVCEWRTESHLQKSAPSISMLTSDPLHALRGESRAGWERDGGKFSACWRRACLDCG